MEECPHSEPPSDRVLLNLCYPRRVCRDVIEELSLVGVEGLCYTGRYQIHPFIIGKGHSSIVVLARWRRIISAVKVRRSDSKRESLYYEGIMLEEAHRGGVAPKPYYYSKNIIIMDYVPGPHLGELVQTRQWKKAILEALEAARALDNVNILHYELRRPWRHVRYTRGGKAIVLDYESSKRGCGSLLKILGGLIPLLGGSLILKDLKPYLIRYSLTCDENSYNSIMRIVRESLEKLNEHSLRSPRHPQDL